MNILIVEDYEDQAELIAGHARALGWSPATARTLEAAIEQLHTTHYDLVLLDFRLPDSAGGMETIIRVCWAATPTTPIVAISETEDRNEILYFIRHGGAALLRKQFLDRDSLEWARQKAEARIAGIRDLVDAEVALAKRQASAAVAPPTTKENH